MVRCNPPREWARVTAHWLKESRYADLPWVKRFLTKLEGASSDADLRRLKKQLENFIQYIDTGSVPAAEPTSSAPSASPSVDEINQALLMGTLGIGQSGQPVLMPGTHAADPGRPPHGGRQRRRAAPPQPEPGSISSGDMRPITLIPRFYDELRRTAPAVAESRRIRNEMMAWEREVADGETDPEDDNRLVNLLCEALNEVGPPGLYFGAHPGDGADFGWWPVGEDIDEADTADDTSSAATEPPYPPTDDPGGQEDPPVGAWLQHGSAIHINAIPWATDDIRLIPNGWSYTPTGWQRGGGVDAPATIRRAATESWPRGGGRWFLVDNRGNWSQRDVDRVPVEQLIDVHTIEEWDEAAGTEAVPTGPQPGGPTVIANIEVKGDHATARLAVWDHDLRIQQQLGSSASGHNTRFRVVGPENVLIHWYGQAPFQAPYPPGALIHYTVMGPADDEPDTADEEPSSAELVAVLDEFTRAYAEAALWSTNDESDESGGVPLDRNYGISDIALTTLRRMRSDCIQFQAVNAAALRESGLSDSRAGHDFWLNRNGHGTGFWDEEGAFDPRDPRFGPLHTLDAAAKRWGEFNLCVDDDGTIYG